MDKLASNVVSVCNGMIPYVWALAGVALFIIGVAFIIPSEKSHHFAKTALPGVFVGTIVVVGSVYLARWLFGLISF